MPRQLGRQLLATMSVTAVLAFSLVPLGAAQAEDGPAGATSSAAPTPAAGADKEPTGTSNDAPEKAAEKASEKAPDKAAEPTPDKSEKPSTSPSATPTPENSESGSDAKATDEPTPSPSGEDSPAATDDSTPAPSAGAAAETPAAKAAPADEAPAAKAAAACTPADRSSSITDVTLSTTNGTSEVGAWDKVRLDFKGSLPDGGCAGDTVKITVPPELQAFGGSYPVKAPDGTVMGEMVVAGGTATITFNNYVETHKSITYRGFFSLQTTDKLQPGQRYDLKWQVGEKVFVTPVTAQECPDCEGPKTHPNKFAYVVDGDPDTVYWGISSAITQSAGESIKISDKIGEGQRLDCSTIVVRTATSRTNWGDINWGGPITASPVCDESTGEVSVSLTATAAGQYYGLFGSSVITEPRDFYTDTGKVEQAGTSHDIPFQTQTREGGADGNGTGYQPAIDIEKWSTDEGIVAGDHDTDSKPLDPTKTESITFTIKNTGDEALRDVTVSDTLDSGVGAITGLSCDFSKLGGPESGTTWAGPFKVGDSFTCTGTLPALGEGQTHTDTASVTGTGVASGKVVTDSDKWLGHTPVTEIVSPPFPVKVVTHGGGSSTSGGGSSTLPATGAADNLAPLGLAGLLLVGLGGALLWRRQRG